MLDTLGVVLADAAVEAHSLGGEPLSALQTWWQALSVAGRLAAGTSYGI